MVLKSEAKDPKAALWRVDGEDHRLYGGGGGGDLI